MLNEFSLTTLLRAFTPGLWPFGPLRLLLAVFLIAWAWAWLRGKRRGGFRPVRRPRPPRASRIAEGVVLFTTGAIVIVFVGTSPLLKGVLLIPGDLHPEFTLVNRFLAALAGVFVLFGTVFVLRGFFRHGFALVLFTLVAYPFVLAGPFKIPERLTPEGKSAPVAHLTFTAGAVPGVDIWVNDVYLGKTPVEITWEEFNAKVPYWPEPPEGYVPWDDWYLNSRRESKDPSKEPADPPWTKLEIYEFGTTRWFSSQRKRNYYARLRLGDEWGRGLDGSSGANGIGYSLHSGISTSVSFKGALTRFQNLLIQARLADYQVGEEWFRSMETYGPYAWQQLRWAALEFLPPQGNRAFSSGRYRRYATEVPERKLRESGLAEVADRWARWRYGIRPDMTPHEAWEAFEAIREEADRVGGYRSNSPAGRAVELLVPMMDERKIVATALDTIPNLRWRAGPATSGWASSYGFYFKSRYPGRSAGVYAIAHAVWKLDHDLDALDDSRPNIVEERIEPALLCWGPYLDEALYLGGEHAERFLLRQDLEKEPAQGSPNALPVWGQEVVNSQLVRAALLESPAGKRIRREHADKLLDAAVKMIEPSGDLRDLEFIFMDNETGADSLAMRFWPRYLARMTKDEDISFTEMQKLFTCLTLMEPATTLDMYVSLCHDYAKGSELAHSLDPLRDLPVARRKEVFEALLEEVEGNLAFYIARSQEGQDEDWFETFVLSNIRQQIAGAEREIQSGPRERQISPVGWQGFGGLDYRRHELETAGPDHPLIEQMARDGNPERRVTVLRALRAYPVGKNRELLEELRNDPNEKVRTAAEEVKRELDELATTPPSEFAVPGL